MHKINIMRKFIVIVLIMIPLKSLTSTPTPPKLVCIDLFLKKPQLEFSEANFITQTISKLNRKQSNMAYNTIELRKERATLVKDIKDHIFNNLSSADTEEKFIKIQQSINNIDSIIRALDTKQRKLKELFEKFSNNIDIAKKMDKKLTVKISLTSKLIGNLKKPPHTNVKVSGRIARLQEYRNNLQEIKILNRYLIERIEVVLDENSFEHDSFITLVRMRNWHTIISLDTSIKELDKEINKYTYTDPSNNQLTQEITKIDFVDYEQTEAMTEAIIKKFDEFQNAIRQHNISPEGKKNPITSFESLNKNLSLLPNGFSEKNLTTLRNDFKKHISKDGTARGFSNYLLFKRI